jgi:PTS system galactitol-specific IIC component
MMMVAAVCAVIYAGLWFWVRNDIKKQYAKEMGLDQNGKKVAA